MIIVEQLGNRERRYSDRNVYLRLIETGVLYQDAVDVSPCQYTYEESDVPIEEEPIDPLDALDMIFGGIE